MFKKKRCERLLKSLRMWAQRMGLQIWGSGGSCKGWTSVGSVVTRVRTIYRVRLWLDGGRRRHEGKTGLLKPASQLAGQRAAESSDLFAFSSIVCFRPALKWSLLGRSIFSLALDTILIYNLEKVKETGRSIVQTIQMRRANSTVIDTI